MDFVKIVVGVILPYVALLVFTVGMIYRIYTWRKLASPTMTLFPAPPDEKASAVNTLQEVVLFKSLFRGDRTLWLFAWSFHAVLALIAVGHLRVFAPVDAILKAVGMSEDSIRTMSAGAGGAAGILILIALLLLLVRRMTVQRVKEVTGPADYLALGLIGVIIITGDIMRFGGEHFDLALTRQYFGALATFSSVAGMKALENGMFVFHMFLALVLIMAIPFSKILHLGGIFFTHQMIRKH